MTDYTNSLPDECLALIFNYLTTTFDRNSSSLVSHRWLRIDAQTRRHLSLNAKSDLKPFIPSIFTRFNSLTQLFVIGKYVGISDNDMILITSLCPNLTALKLRKCKRLTDSGIALFSKNCKKLKKFSCSDCKFTSIGMAALLDNSSQLEVLSLKRLLCHAKAKAEFPAGAAAKSLKVVKLLEVQNASLFVPLIAGSKILKTLQLISCGGSWDGALDMISDDSCLVEVHLDDVFVTDVGVSSLSKCRDLTTLHIGSSSIYSSLCTDAGLISVAENCKGLKKLRVENWSMRGIGDEGLIAVGKHIVNLQELALIGVNASCVSLEVIATNCQKLVRLELGMCEMISDVEMSCIAEKCVALKILRIEKCGVSNEGIEALGSGCPNLVKLRVRRCRKVTHEVGDLLRAKRGSLVVKIHQ